MIPDCTLTTACFDLTKYHKGSRNLEVSINNMTPLLEIPCYLVIYTDNICIQLIKDIRNSFNLDYLTYYVVIDFEDLPHYKYLEKINSNREKYWPTRDERTSSESHIICCSKFGFVLNTIEQNPFNTTTFGWIDSNLGENCSKICENYKADMIFNILNNANKTKFHIQILNVTDKKYKKIDYIKDYYSKYRWVVSGCLFITGKDIGIKVLNRLNEIFITTTELGYGHAEEMLYLEVLDEFYNDIERSYGDYGQIINNYFYPTCNLNYIYRFIVKGYLNLSYNKECYDCCKELLNSIEIHNIGCESDIYMDILFSYYVSSYYYKQNESLKIINHIYDVCNINNNMLVEFNKNKDFYESQFKYCNELKPKYKLVINIFACNTIEKYKEEIIKINETWGKKAEELGVKLLFFLGEEPTDLMDNERYIYLKGVSNDHQSASYKQNLGLKYIYEHFNADFIFTCGTDTYINIRNLLVYLDMCDKNKDLYIGGHGDYRQIGEKNIYYHSGGSGFIITNNILGKIYSSLYNIQTDWTAICEKNNVNYLLVACDVQIAYYLDKLNVEIVNNDNFYACNYKGYCYNYTFDCCSKKININEIVSCHYMSLTDFDEYTEFLENNKSK